MRNADNVSDAPQSTVEEDAERESIVRTRYRVSGMDCGSCAAKIETALKRIPGVKEVSVSVPAGTVAVTHAETTAPEQIAAQVTGLGYEVACREHPSGSAPTDH